MWRRGWIPCLTVLATLVVAAPAAAAGPGLRAGAGRADITPQTGYYLGGWTRADRVAQGQHTRLFARALVLQRGTEKVALVSVDLFMVPGGMVQQIGDRLRERGFSERNILISASHTHSGPGGYANFPTLNTAAPSLQTASDPMSFVRLLDPSAADPQLYRFLTDQITTAIRRADDDRFVAEAGWGSARIDDLTENRSLEAHLNNHGIQLLRGEGRPAMDPDGAIHTIDPNVDVLRVQQISRRKDKKGRRIRIPIGAWSQFADHGTVTKSSFQFYNADHHASATRVFEAAVRKLGKVKGTQDVVNVYGNSAEGDQSAGLHRDGPAASDYVGRVEAGAMLGAWKQAGKRMSRTPAFATRWTRGCFCGQSFPAGKNPQDSSAGLPFITGSEEERGPLFDITKDTYEGDRLPVPLDPHGYKIALPLGDLPRGIPLLTIRLGDRLIASLPGEGTKEVGARIKTAVSSAVAGSGIERVVIAGLANEFELYFTTPEEYDRQHYEGGNTHWGRASSLVLQTGLAELAGRLARGEPATEPFPFDPTNGVAPNGPQYSDGAGEGSLTEQPAERYARFQRARIRWNGGAKGLDRPVDRAFVTAERQVKGKWVRYDDDLGLAMLWRVDSGGHHTADWEIPRNAPTGTYRLVVTAKRYRLESRAFAVDRSSALTVRSVDAAAGRKAVVLDYPEAKRDVDLTYRPRSAPAGVVRFRVGGKLVRVRSPRSGTFSVRVPAGQSAVVESAVDRYGNVAR